MSKVKGRKSKSARRAAQPASIPAGSAPALRPGRQWLFRIVAMLLPVFALVLVEIALRIAGYGYSTSFFKQSVIGSETFLIENDKFGLRFFPPELVRMPAPTKIKSAKAAGTFRIFVFGESAAMGDPEPAFGAGRYLEVLLRERFPGRQFEVINVAMTAINSHAILPIARDCAGHEGDLWIIYMGNNEMVGPFGAATVFGARAPPLAFIRFNLALQRTRLGQLFTGLARQWQGKSSKSPSWGGMEMFLENQVAPGDPRKESVYHHFRSNLKDIVNIGCGSGARILLSTVAVNLKDCPPFGSISKLGPNERPELEKLMREGLIAEKQGNPKQAAECYARAARLDSNFADLQYRLGACKLQASDVSAALTCLQLACDADALPFRADSRINDTIREVWAQFAGKGVTLFDAVAAMKTNSAAGICGQESFYEHVHFNFDGNYRLARGWAEQVEKLFPDASAGAGTSKQTDWASQEICERRLGLSAWTRINVLESMARRLQRPPLSTQSNNGERLRALQAQVSDLRSKMNTNAISLTRELYLEALQRAPDDFYLHQHYADFLEAMGELKQSELEWRKTREMIPQDFLAYFQLGRLLGRQGQTAEAATNLLHALSLRPTFSDGWFELGKIDDFEGKLERALARYEKARLLQPQNYQIYCYKGKVLSRLNRRTEAIEALQESVRLNPDYWEGHYALGGAYGYNDQIKKAKHEFEEVIRLNPAYAMAHLNLGVALMKERQLTEAKLEFERTLSLEPENRLARDYLRVIERK